MKQIELNASSLRHSAIQLIHLKGYENQTNVIHLLEYRDYMIICAYIIEVLVYVLVN